MKNKSRSLGIDFGLVRIGIAITDDQKKIASALTTITFSKNNFLEAVNKIKILLKKYGNINEIILGYPLKQNNQKSSTTLAVEKFYQILKNNISIPIILFDESYSTSNTISYLKDFADLKFSKIKKVKDKLAAQYILQNYLDSKQNESRDN